MTARVVENACAPARLPVVRKKRHGTMRERQALQQVVAVVALAAAKAQLAQAEINRTRTEVRAPVNGRMTNLLLRVGDYATTGTVNIAVIDTDSFWIDGSFEETKMARIHVGDPVTAELLRYDSALPGRVESITLGISIANAAPSTQGLPSVDPVFTWVRLAQRVRAHPHRARARGRAPGGGHDRDDLGGRARCPSAALVDGHARALRRHDRPCAGIHARRRPPP